MGLFDAAGGAAAATPYGAAAQAALAIANTPNTSASGDITSGFKDFRSQIGGIAVNSGVPTWVVVAGGIAIAVAAFFMLQKR